MRRSTTTTIVVLSATFNQPADLSIVSCRMECSQRSSSEHATFRRRVNNTVSMKIKSDSCCASLVLLITKGKGVGWSGWCCLIFIWHLDFAQNDGFPIFHFFVSRRKFWNNFYTPSKSLWRDDFICAKKTSKKCPKNDILSKNKMGTFIERHCMH